MELALSVIGQMASLHDQWKSLGYMAGSERGGAGAPGVLLVHRYFDRRAVADVA